MPILSTVKSRRALLYSILLLSFLLLSVEQAAAQPGDDRSPEQIEKELLERLDKLEEEIRRTPSRASLYAGRGGLYLRLYIVTDNLNRSDRYYVEKGFADFATAIELDPQPDFFAARADSHRNIWWHQLSQLASAPAEARIEILLRSPHFDEAVSDFLQATELIDDTQASKRYSYYIRLSSLYSNRAQYLYDEPELIKAMRRQGEKYTVWEDFDTTISYISKTVVAPGNRPRVLELYLNKGDWAYRLGEYEVALEAYKSDVEYLGQNYHLLCKDDTDNPDECENNKRRWLLVFSLKRVKAYLKLGQAEKALAELDTYFPKADTHTCPQPFLLRAEAYRQLGKIGLALEDEQKVREIPNSSDCTFQ